MVLYNSFLIHYHLSWICLLLHEGEEFRRGGLRSTLEYFCKYSCFILFPPILIYLAMSPCAPMPSISMSWISSRIEYWGVELLYILCVFVTTWLKAQAKHQTSIKFNKPSKQKNFISYFQPSLNCRHHSRSILQRSPFQCLVYSLSASWRRTRFISMPAFEVAYEMSRCQLN